MAGGGWFECDVDTFCDILILNKSDEQIQKSPTTPDEWSDGKNNRENLVS